MTLDNKNSDTVTLLRKLGYPNEGTTLDCQPISEISEPLYDVARKNKVAALLVKQYISKHGQERVPPYAKERIEYMSRMRRTLKKLESDVDRDDIALVKTALPFWVDASDIDIIAFNSNSLMDFGESLENAGFQSKESTPTAYALRDPETDIVIDAQTNFSAKHVIYFNADTLSGGVEQRSIYGAKLPCVALPKDLALIAVHSITEQMFTMKEFYAAISILERINESDLEIFKEVIRKNCAEPAASAFFSLIYYLSHKILKRTPPYANWFVNKYNISSHGEMRRLKENGFSLPHKYSIVTFSQFLIHKMKDKRFRKTIKIQLNDFKDPKSLVYFISKIYNRRKREHYSRDY